MTKKVYIRTFGCQMNVYDTGKMRALLAKQGYGHTESMADADVILVNTCSIREKPELKVHSFLGEARREKRGIRARIPLDKRLPDLFFHAKQFGQFHLCHVVTSFLPVLAVGTLYPRGK